MKLLLLSFMFLFYSASYAQDINGRLNISKKIMQLYQEHCLVKSEEIKMVFELAATYIIHGEYVNMKEQLLKARSFSKNAGCHKAIDKFLY